MTGGGHQLGVTIATPARRSTLRRGLVLEYFTLGWNLLEAVVGMAAGLAAGSIALVGFALDSLIESSSAAVLIWRLRAEASGRAAAAEVEGRAVRMVGAAFLALGAYVGARSVINLVNQARPEESAPGIALALVSLVVMPLLARRKKAAARSLDSRALQADSIQTWLCTYLSAFLLAGLLANSLLGWWWADAVAGIAIAGFALKEGLELWSAEDFCCR